MASIRKRPWKKGDEMCIAWQVDWIDASGKRHRRQFSTRREADAFRVETENQLLTGSFRSGGQKITVAELAKEFLAYCEARHNRGERMTYSVLINYRGHINRYILGNPASPKPPRGSRAREFYEGIGALKLAQVTPSQVHQFRDRMRKAGLTIAAARMVLTTLHTLFEFAKSRDLMATNPAHRVRVIGRRDEGSKRIEPPSKDLVAALLEVAPPGTRLMLLFAVSTGLRAGEQRALRWKHVDFDRGEVGVHTRVDYRGHEDGQGAKICRGQSDNSDFIFARRGVEGMESEIGFFGIFGLGVPKQTRAIPEPW